jgi:hypothetical protein
MKNIGALLAASKEIGLELNTVKTYIRASSTE